MSATQWVGLGAGLLLVAFIAFAFRQGNKVKPRQGIPQSPYDTSGDYSGHGDSHGGGDAGH